MVFKNCLFIIWCNTIKKTWKKAAPIWRHIGQANGIGGTKGAKAIGGTNGANTIGGTNAY